MNILTNGEAQKDLVKPKDPKEAAESKREAKPMKPESSKLDPQEARSEKTQVDVKEAESKQSRLDNLADDEGKSSKLVDANQDWTC